MSLTWFELPPPAQLGDGWSLRFLTAAQMLECRREGEERAQEERDKALWANASLLSRVLLKEGEPAFPSGEAVLESLTVGQMDSLTRRWWAQDDFSGQLAQEGRPTPEGWGIQAGRPVRGERDFQQDGSAQKGWAAREQGENERFDMARYLELGGEVRETSQVPVEGGFAAVAPSAVSQVWPQVWPGRALAPRGPETVQRMYREPYMSEGMAMPQGTMDIPVEVLPSGTGKSSQGDVAPQAEHSVVQVLMPETAEAGGGLTVEELDRAVERDARRYDGGSSLY